MGERRWLAAVLFLALLGGCAAPTTKSAEINSVLAEIETRKQRELALEEEINGQRRLSVIAYRILSGAVSLCGEKVRPSIGFGYWSKYRFDDPWREIAMIRFGLSSVIQVFEVFPGSPAEETGIEPGDILLAVNDWEAPVGKEALKTTDKKLREILEKSPSPISMRLLRNGEEMKISVEPEKICDYPVVMDPGDEVNAYADGEKVMVSKGMMHFAQDDTELSLVVSHEVAHNSMKHIEAKKQNAMAGAAGGFLVDLLFAAMGANTQGDFSRKGAEIGSSAYSVEFEQEADYVGLYALALSGLDIENAPNFWRRMAARSPTSIQFRTSHPTTPERFVALEAAVKEIKAKIASNLPLKPEMKKPKETKPGSKE